MSNFRYAVVRTIKPYIKYFPQLTKPVLNTLIQVAIHYIGSKKCSPEVLDLAISKLTESGNDIPQNFCELFAAVLQIIQIYLRTPKGAVKIEELKDCLKEDLKLNDECVEDLTKVLQNNRSTLINSYLEAKMIRGNIRNLQWRLNISLIPPPEADSKVKSTRNLMPTIILHFQLRNGQYRTLEMSTAMFHRLRYNVAALFNQMLALEQRAVMKKF